MDICYQCRFEFVETSIQYNRRIRNNTPKICQECYRIENAEARAEKRAQLRYEDDQKQQSLFYKNRLEILKLYKNEEKLSRTLLQRRHKLSSEEAQEIVELHESLK